LPDVFTKDLPPATGADRLRGRVADAATLSGRMAHDFDNLLMGILGFTELAMSQAAQGSDQHKFLGELYQCARRGQAITQQMHDFSRCGRIPPVPTRLADVWQAEVVAVRSRTAGKAVIEGVIRDDLPAVMVAPEPLALVVRHLLANAVEALPDGAGRVTADARAVELADPSADYLPAELPPGDYLEFCITDSGPGIRPDVLGQLAEAPFVTTKVRHRGLGVAIVYRVLDAFGGGVRFEAARPCGTRVTVLLPAARAAQAARTQPRAVTPTASR
jgi:signal transduction histidine kinase